MVDFGFERLGHQIGAQREFDVACTPGFEDVVRGTSHLEGGRRGQFSGLAVLELVQRDVHAGQLGHFASTVFEKLHTPNGCVLQGEILQVELGRLGGCGGGRGRGRGLCLLFQERVKIAATIGLLDDLDYRRADGDFIHFERAAHDGEQAVAQSDFLSLQERLGAGGLDPELTEGHLRERAQGGVSHRDLAAHCAADPRQNDALEKRRTRDDEIGRDEQHEQGATDEEKFAAPRAATARLGTRRKVRLHPLHILPVNACWQSVRKRIAHGGNSGVDETQTLWSAPTCRRF